MANVAVENKGKTLDSAIFQIQKQFGKGSIMRLGADERVAVPAISTGILSLDIATGIGGIPGGRITEIYGPESSGKTTLALQIIAAAQRQGGAVAFIDAEHALDVTYAERLGVNADDLLISQPDYGEQALEITEILIRSGAMDVIVVDSVAALTPKAEIDGNIGDSHMGLQARLMSQTMRKLAAILQRTNTAIIFINQIRMKIGVMFGNPETTTGGNALKFYSSMRIDIRRMAAIKDGEEVIGNRVKAKLVKNKVAPPFKVAEFDIIFGEGSSREGDLLDLAVNQNIIDKSGAWYSYNGERIGQGRENSKQFMREHPEMTDEIERKVRLGFGLPMPGESRDQATGEAAAAGDGSEAAAPGKAVKAVKNTKAE
ncbi:recombinase RecA [Desulfurivibrio dismutans]|uniref:recombinase RecA n=1 Tax=Desulfurivibrio dismutans TaxID=1398908 RepID=UPI0023DAED55|nr:recombinase RecA [Desulfurivibrio alkaliphilus]MDF1615615.1 recombinase RecA [Desulfurivibrio alkaliphilus]